MNQEEFWRTSEKPAEGLPPTSLALTVSKEVTDLATAPTSALIDEAEAFVVDTEPAFQMADQIQNRLKQEAKQINDKRLEFTRPIDALKKKWMDVFSPQINARTEAAEIYRRRMSAYLKVQREENEKKQREAERLLAEQKAKQEAEARRLEEKAAKLKTEQARQRALAEAESIRTVAAMTPASVPVATAPQTVASNVAELWEAEVTDTPRFLRWLAEHPEWHGVLSFKTGEMNRLAKQFKNVVAVPGLTIGPKDSFRSKPR